MTNLFMSWLWFHMAFAFSCVQELFNGNFWEIFAKRFESLTRGRVLDLACGTGDLLECTNPKKYLGVDFNRSYIIWARKRFKNRKHALFVKGDITKKMLPKQIFDAVFLVSAAHHFSDEQMQAIAQLVAKTKVSHFIVVDGYPKGVLAPILTFLDGVLAGGWYFRKHKQMVSLVKPNFKIIQQGEFTARHSFYRYPYFVAAPLRILYG